MKMHQHQQKKRFIIDKNKLEHLPSHEKRLLLKTARVKIARFGRQLHHNTITV